MITGYFYFLLKYMFHAGFVTFHNSQQKHNETSGEPPGGILPHNIRQEDVFVAQYKTLYVHISTGIINGESSSAVTCRYMLFI